MTILKMKKIVVATTHNNVKKILKSLQKQGFFHLSQLDSSTQDQEQQPQSQSIDTKKLDYLLKNFLKYQTEKKEPIEMFVIFDKRKTLKDKQFLSSVQKITPIFDTIYEKYKTLEQKISEQKAIIEQTKKERDLLLQLEPLKSNLKKIISTIFKAQENPGKITYELGIIKDNADKGDKSIINILYYDKKARKSFALFAFHNEKSKKPIYDKIDIPSSWKDKDYKQILFELDTKIANANRKIQQLEEEKKELALKHLEGIKALYDFINLNNELNTGIKNIKKSRFISVFTGYVPEKYTAKTIGIIESLSQGKAVVIATDPDKNDKVPILLKNSSFIQPFEGIVSTYSLPNYHEKIDPALFIAPFFFAFFGICMTEAGYGIVISLASYFLRNKYPQMKRFWTLMMFLGVSTFIFGMLFGTFMGWSIEDGKLPPGDFIPHQFLPPLIGGVNHNIFNLFKDYEPVPIIGQFIHVARQADFTNPIVFLVFALLLGLFHITIGIILSFYKNLKLGNTKQALLENLPWVIFMVLANAKVFDIIFLQNSVSILNTLIQADVLLIILTGVISGKGVVGKILGVFTGTIKLYDIIGFFSDMLSYSRLLALGLSTGIIAYVVNLLVDLSNKLIPVIGGFIGVLVFIFGHLANIVLSSLSAYIHSSRLQYVEYFSKFYEGNGLKFKPLGINTKYYKRR